MSWVLPRSDCSLSIKLCLSLLSPSIEWSTKRITPSASASYFDLFFLNKLYLNLLSELFTRFGYQNWAFLSESFSLNLYIYISLWLKTVFLSISEASTVFRPIYVLKFELLTLWSADGDILLFYSSLEFVSTNRIKDCSLPSSYWSLYFRVTALIIICF